MTTEQIFAHLCSQQHYSQLPKGRNKSKHSLTDKCINKMWHMHKEILVLKGLKF